LRCAVDDTQTLNTQTLITGKAKFSWSFRRPASPWREAGLFLLSKLINS
jgi:hypothetical protein